MFSDSKQAQNIFFWRTKYIPISKEGIIIKTPHLVNQNQFHELESNLYVNCINKLETIQLE